MMPSVLAVIPARAGSKGVPGKNLRALNGLPLLAHSIRVAQSARCVSSIFLSTDCSEIAAVGRAYGAQVPFLRPATLAQDHSPVADAVRDLLQRLERTQPLCEWLLLLQPTSPFRTAADIEAAVDWVRARGATALVSVAPAASHPYLCRSIDSGGVLTPLVESPLNRARRQELPPAYVLNGALYLIQTKRFLEEEVGFCPDDAIAYVMPPERSVDLDTFEDFEWAEFLMKRGGEHERRGF